MEMRFTKTVWSPRFGICRSIGRRMISASRSIRGVPVRLTVKVLRMKYMLLIYCDEQALSETERQECYVESAQLAEQIHASGQYLAANPLHPTAMRHQRPGA